MGGPGSGKWGYGGSRYLTTEQCYDLDIADLRRAGMFRPGAKASTTWEWWTNNDPERSSTVGVEIDLRDLEAPQFAVRYAIGEEPLSFLGWLETTRPQYGGVRYWFRCPRCGRRRRVLYVYPSNGWKRFACRRCHGLRYYSHRESPQDRLARRARKLWRRAGSKDGCEPWVKPKWMRWATFSRLVLMGRAAQEHGDLIVLGRFGVEVERLMSACERRSRKKLP